MSCALDCKNSYWSLFSAKLNIRALNNGILTLSLGYDSTYSVNRVKVLEKDLLSTNGVLNIIDAVLEPRRSIYPYGYRNKYRRRHKDD